MYLGLELEGWRGLGGMGVGFRRLGCGVWGSRLSAVHIVNIEINQRL